MVTRDLPDIIGFVWPYCGEAVLVLLRCMNACAGDSQPGQPRCSFFILQTNQQQLAWSA